MQSSITEGLYQIDIVPYAEAPWAPVAPGASLRWAYRIVDAAGQPKMVGSSNDSEQKVREFARAAVTRLKLLNNGKPSRANVMHVLRPRNGESNASGRAVAE